MITFTYKQYKHIERLLADNDEKVGWDKARVYYRNGREKVEVIQSAFHAMRRRQEIYNGVCDIIMQDRFLGLMHNGNSDTAISGIAQFYHGLRYDQLEEALAWLNQLKEDSQKRVGDAVKSANSEGTMWSPTLILKHDMITRVMAAMGPY